MGPRSHGTLYLRHQDRRRIRELRLFYHRTYDGVIQTLLDSVPHAVSYWDVDWLTWYPWEEIPKISVSVHTMDRLYAIGQKFGRRPTEVMATILDLFDQHFEVDYRTQFRDYIG